MRRRRYLRNVTIDYIVAADPTYPGHQLVCPAFADRIKSLAAAHRMMTFREVEDAFAIVEPEYREIIGHRGQRVRGRGRKTRWQADKLIHTLMSHVERAVPAEYRLPRTGNLSLCEAMANAFGCGAREVEQAWSRRAMRPKRAVKR